MDKKILLVDDEEGIRKVLGISLADSGYEVLTAENGEQALRLFRKNRPPIVMTDIKMPGIDGISLLQKIKSELPDTEVIMITGHGDMELAIKSLQLQAIDFVTKPINDDVLEIALNRATEKITMREQLRQYTENLESLVKEQSAKLVKAERLAAVGQAIEGLSTAIRGIAGDLEGGIRYFNEMPCFVSIHNRDLKIVETNQLFKQRLGNGVGSNSWDIYKQVGQKPENCLVARTFQTGKGQRGREIVRCKDGRELPVMIHTAPIQNKEGELELVLEIAADISEVHRLQEELRTTQQRYQQLFDEAPCYISVQDRDLRLTATNRRFKEDFGEQKQSHCFEVYKNRGEPCPNCPVAKTFSDGKSHQSEMVVTSAHGEQYNVLIWTAPIRNAAGEIIQVMEMMTNITQIRQLQDHLTSLGFLISSISHGIKGLLTGLDGGMYLIQKGVERKQDDKIKEGWDVVQLMVDRIRSLVQNILFYAKERQLHAEKVDVLGFAEDLCLTVVHKTDAHGIEFTKHFAPSLGSFEVDANVVRTALINILENALEAVTADKTKDTRRISLEVRREKKTVVFEIRDNGIGMDQETMENLFTLFFSTKGHAGTGLGLYVAEKVIQQHGGNIEVESSAGEGSRFQVSLPVSLPPSIRKAMKTAGPATAPR
ncbi:MAG: histidine kinase [Deltaproteobacteria bacterium SG8_13]|nr:MAG: histidine kinase [Deltaproteobacteria bacterium SG8_13]